MQGYVKDALKEMMLACKELGKEIPAGNALIEQLPVEDVNDSQTPAQLNRVPFQGV